MRKFSWKFAVALLTFGVGVFVASILLFCNQPKLENSETGSFSQIEPLVAQTRVIERNNTGFIVAGVKSDEEVEQFWDDFQKMVADDDRNQVASMANYPLKVNYYFDSLKKNYILIRNRIWY